MSDKDKEILRDLVGIIISIIAWNDALGLHNQQALIKQLSEINDRIKNDNP